MSQKYSCPNCTTTLVDVPTKYGILWSCTGCKGRSIGLALLQMLSKPELVQQLWIGAKKLNQVRGKNCPACRKKMLSLRTNETLGSVEIDLCAVCYLIWFDKNELEKFPKSTEEERERRQRENNPTPKVAPVSDPTYGYVVNPYESPQIDNIDPDSETALDIIMNLFAPSRRF